VDNIKGMSEDHSPVESMNGKENPSRGVGSLLNSIHLKPYCIPIRKSREWTLFSIDGYFRYHKPGESECDTMILMMQYVRYRLNSIKGFSMKEHWISCIPVFKMVAIRWLYGTPG